MKVWVDADACPKAIKEILFRASEKREVPMTLVANAQMRIPSSSFINFVLVPAGFDVADNEIVNRLEKDDLVITADIPLAAEVIEKGGHALNPRGELYSPDTIRERLNMRDFMDILRGGGVITGGPAALGPKDKQRFANELDKWITRHSAS